MNNTVEECLIKIEEANKLKDPNDFFIMRKRGLIRNPEYRKFMGGKGTVYEHIWSNLVRKEMKNDLYNIKEKYWDRGFLAYGSTYNHVAKECFMSKNTVIGYINEFEQIGGIKTEKLGPPPRETDKRGRIIDRRKTVFILGTWQIERVNHIEKIREYYYLDDVFYK